MRAHRMVRLAGWLAAVAAGSGGAGAGGLPGAAAAKAQPVRAPAATAPAARVQAATVPAKVRTTTVPATEKPAGEKTPADNLDYWLNQAKPAATQPTQPAGVVQPSAATQPAGGQAANPFGPKADEFRRADALPGVVELSDGRQLPGGVYTTVEKPWIVWFEDTKSWRRVPFLTVLSIAAVVEEERVELNWRWKGMGEPEKVYTGEKYPFRRMHWRFRLIDGSIVEGSTKGQPVWVEVDGKAHGPFVLHERQKGENGQMMKDLLYVRKVVVSRKMMEAVLEDLRKQSQGGSAAAGKPSAGARK